MFMIRTPGRLAFFNTDPTHDGCVLPVVSGLNFADTASTQWDHGSDRPEPVWGFSAEKNAYSSFDSLDDLHADGFVSIPEVCRFFPSWNDFSSSHAVGPNR